MQIIKYRLRDSNNNIVGYEEWVTPIPNHNKSYWRYYTISEKGATIDEKCIDHYSKEQFLFYDKNDKPIYVNDKVKNSDGIKGTIVYGTYSIGKDEVGLKHTTIGFAIRYADGSGYVGVNNLSLEEVKGEHYGFSYMELEKVMEEES